MTLSLSKKAGRYKVSTTYTLSARANIVNVAAFGMTNITCAGRPNTYDTISSIRVLTCDAGDTAYITGRDESGTCTVSFLGLLIEPLFM